MNCGEYSPRLQTGLEGLSVTYTNQGILKGEVLTSFFGLFVISWMTTDNFCFYSQDRLFKTSQTGGQRYSDTSPFSIIPCTNLFFCGFDDEEKRKVLNNVDTSSSKCIDFRFPAESSSSSGRKNRDLKVQQFMWRYIGNCDIDFFNFCET